MYNKKIKTSLKILYLGAYSKGIEYPRNNNLIRGLRLNGHQVIECHFSLAESFSSRIGIVRNKWDLISFLLRLIASYAVLTWKFLQSPQTDVIIVGHPGYFHVHYAWFLRLLFNKKAILVYDAFIPLYEALVEDRRLFRPDSIFARLIQTLEASCCRCCNVCLTDTEEHRRYLIYEFGLSPESISRVFVGATINQRRKRLSSLTTSETYNVLYVGTYIPLHGVETILKAAAYLIDDPHIRLLLVGSGQLRNKMADLFSQLKLTNVVFQDWVPTDKLSSYIGTFDLSLGIFGNSPKTARVIPSKIFDACAVGVPFITADTPAIREVFHHGENAYLVPPENPESLAEAIVHLKSHPILAKEIAEHAWKTGRDLFSPTALGRNLTDSIEKAMSLRKAAE